MFQPLLIDEPPLQVLPSLSKLIGLNEALVLQQIHYWLNPKFNQNFFSDRYWVWNTYEQWQQQFSFWSEKTIRRTINKLEDLGLLESFVTKEFQKLKYYTINYQALWQLGENASFERHPVQEQKQKSSDFSKRQPLKELPEKCETTKIPQTCMSYSPNKMIRSIGTNWEHCSEQHGQTGLDKMTQSIRTDWADRPGQNDQIDQDKMTQSIGTDWADRSGQPDLIDRDKMTSSYYKDTENTYSEITAETTLPPVVRAGALEFPKEEEEELQNLMFVWNETVQQKLNPFEDPCRLNPSRLQRLKYLFEEVCNNKPATWENYCQKISACQFLMGKNKSGFKVNLDWALVPENAYKVLEGALYDKPERSESNSVVLKNTQGSWEEVSKKVQSRLLQGPSSGSYLQEWLTVCQKLFQVLGETIFTAWFLTLKLENVQDDTALIQAENTFQRDYINNHFRFEIERAVRSVFPTVHFVTFQTAKRSIQ